MYRRSSRVATSKTFANTTEKHFAHSAIALRTNGR